MQHSVTPQKVTAGAKAHAGKASPNTGAQLWDYRTEINPGQRRREELPSLTASALQREPEGTGDDGGGVCMICPLEGWGQGTAH